MIPFTFEGVDKTSNNYDETMEEVYRLRFKVYCEEWKFEDTKDYPDGMERNEYDDFSEHFIIRCTEDKSIVGTARIILPNALGYPMTQHCEIVPEMHEQALQCVKTVKIGEVSRLAISKEYRKRIEDDALVGYASMLPFGTGVVHEQRKCNYVHEFYKFLLLSSMNMGLSHWYVAMKRGLYVLLKRVGMIYYPVGPEIDYHGLRTPYLGNLQELRLGMERKAPDCFKFIESNML
ncbi:PEP-CTERM/exosortase system-associated acyltransferase [Geobacter grbiciae]|uniref:PEP-CTERM/exosortase system-associated acyltransferase n=1 Tax=Geobacter grbiciae TaxID=155042 RepID=UPI001C020348|nr:PEP-CTERM/exosortase system-associated acyltransferase [Geobacter grbiciae]MBT1074687.1 PEP-CTERM/exosortase system-associated acyltransferase [Geobacter grbiciae]